jgi:hypothetical protein
VVINFDFDFIIVTVLVVSSEFSYVRDGASSKVEVHYADLY